MAQLHGVAENLDYDPLCSNVGVVVSRSKGTSGSSIINLHNSSEDT
jgi:hypothetical protein